MMADCQLWFWFCTTSWKNPTMTSKMFWEPDRLSKTTEMWKGLINLIKPKKRSETKKMVVIQKKHFFPKEQKLSILRKTQVYNMYIYIYLYIYINVQTIRHMILWEVGLYDSLPISVEFARCRWTGVDCLPELHKWAACRPCFFFRDRGTDQLGYWWAHPKKSFLPFHSCYFGVWQI